MCARVWCACARLCGVCVNAACAVEVQARRRVRVCVCACDVMCRCRKSGAARCVYGSAPRTRACARERGERCKRVGARLRCVLRTAARVGQRGHCAFARRQLSIFGQPRRSARTHPPPSDACRRRARQNPAAAPRLLTPRSPCKEPLQRAQRGNSHACWEDRLVG